MEQGTISHFIKSGKYESHIRRINKLNKAQHPILLALFKEYLPHAFEIVDSDAGEHIFGWWCYSEEEYIEFEEQCHMKGVAWYNPKNCFINYTRPSALFAFSHLSKKEMEEGLSIMAQTFNEVMK